MSHRRLVNEIALLLLFYIVRVAVIFSNDRGPRVRCQKSPKTHPLSVKTLHTFLEAIQKAENVSLANDGGGAAVIDDHLCKYTICTMPMLQILHTRT